MGKNKLIKRELQIQNGFDLIKRWKDEKERDK